MIDFQCYEFNMCNTLIKNSSFSRMTYYSLYENLQKSLLCDESHLMS